MVGISSNGNKLQTLAEIVTLNRLLSAKHNKKTKKTVLSLTTLGQKLDLDTNESALMFGQKTRTS